MSDKGMSFNDIKAKYFPNRDFDENGYLVSPTAGATDYPRIINNSEYKAMQSRIAELEAQLAAAQPAIKAMEAIKVMGDIHIEHWHEVWSAQVVDLDGDVLGNGDTPESAINNAYAIYPFQKRK